MALTILVVDDDDIVRSMLSRVLRRAGHTVVDASSYQTALDLVTNAEHRFDVAIADLHLGAARGDDLVREIVASSPGTRPILLTGDEVEVVDAGTTLVQKPIARSQLLRVITAVSGS